MYTAYYDSNRCFEETLSGAFSVHVAGSWFPRSLFGRCMALCAYIRCILIAFRIAWDSRNNPYDVIISDQVSAVNPFLKWLTSAHVVFYCHFPDLLLSQRTSPLHTLYRIPLDWFEQYTTGWADLILVNSQFTQRVFGDTFTRLSSPPSSITPTVLYPAVLPPSDGELQAAKEGWEAALPQTVVALVHSGPTFVSINRFERKKNIGLAIQALKILINSLPKNAPVPKLVIAGGYDARLSENVSHLQELGKLAANLGIRDQVVFLPSFTDTQRAALLSCAVGVVYTPQGEHFGIVPLEAMAAGRPVIACNSGGPLESVVPGQTGFLCKPTPEAFAKAMADVLKPGEAERMGAAASYHVRSKFSRTAFGNALNDAVLELVGDLSSGRGDKKGK